MIFVQLQKILPCHKQLCTHLMNTWFEMRQWVFVGHKAPNNTFLSNFHLDVSSKIYIIKSTIKLEQKLALDINSHQRKSHDEVFWGLEQVRYQKYNINMYITDKKSNNKWDTIQIIQCQQLISLNCDSRMS